MKRKYALLVGVVLVFANSSVAFADDSTSSGSMNMNRGEMKQMMQQGHQEMKAVMQQNRQDLKASMSAMREQLKAKFQAERDAFKAKVAQLKDQRKQRIVTNVTERFEKINSKRTDRMTQHISKLNAILSEIRSKSAKAKADGKETTSVDAAITNAQAALTAAQTAIDAQTANQYIPQVTDDDHVRKQTSTTFNQLKLDLESTRKAILIARDELLTAAQELAKAKGVTQ